jgi:hypothetical protein
MMFSENRFHFPDSALAEVALRREGGKDACRNRALWPHLPDGANSMDKAHGGRAGLRLTKAASDACYRSNSPGAFAYDQD